MSFAACAEIVKQADPARFLPAMTAPPKCRARLFALYAFNAEVARAPWASHEPMIAEMRLRFWADLIADIGKGRIVGSHEIAEPLAGVIAESKLPLLLFEQMITARRWDIYRDPFADRAHFERYIDHTSGHLMWLTACALGTDAALEGAVREHAFAAGIANWLLAVPELSARGRQPLLDDSEAGIAALATGALARLDRARSLKAGQAAPALRAGWQARGILKRAVKVPSKVVMGRLQASEFSRRGLLLMKAATGRY